MLKVNQYFDGNVASIGFQTPTLPATVGVMKVGEYEFGTSQFETMTVISGAISALLPNQTDWQTFKANETLSITLSQGKSAKV